MAPKIKITAEYKTSSATLRFIRSPHIFLIIRSCIFVIFVITKANDIEVSEYINEAIAMRKPINSIKARKIAPNQVKRQ